MISTFHMFSISFAGYEYLSTMSTYMYALYMYVFV